MSSAPHSHRARQGPDAVQAVQAAHCSSPLPTVHKPSAAAVFLHAGAAPQGAPAWTATGPVPAPLKVSISATPATTSSKSPWIPRAARPSSAPYTSATVGSRQHGGKHGGCSYRFSLSLSPAQTRSCSCKACGLPFSRNLERGSKQQKLPDSVTPVTQRTR